MPDIFVLDTDDMVSTAFVWLPDAKRGHTSWCAQAMCSALPFPCMTFVGQGAGLDLSPQRAFIHVQGRGK
jgi:hypothetical protein